MYSVECIGGIGGITYMYVTPVEGGWYMNLEKCGYVVMWPSGNGGGDDKRDFEKNIGSQDYVISN